MPLLIFLLAYLIRRRLDSSGRWDADPALGVLFRKLAASARDDASVVPGLVLVAGTALLLIVVDWSLASRGWPVLVYPLEFVLLLWLMGAPGWNGLVRVYSDAWQRGDMQSAWHHVKDCLHADEQGQAGSPDAMHRSFSRRLMVTLFERYFLIVFWYVVGGIGMALFARGVVALRDHWPAEAERARFSLLVEIMAWLPVRLLSFSFGLAGDLSGWLRNGRRYLMMPSVNAETILMTGASGALTGYALDPERFGSLHPDEWPDFGGRSLRAIRDLLSRSMLVWVCFLALLVIAGVV